MTQDAAQVNLEYEKHLLVDKIHRLLNQFHEKTGYIVAGLETEYEREVNVIHYKTDLTLFEPEEVDA